MQFDSRMHCSVTCHLSWLGGQYGEEGEGEDETGGQEDRSEEDQAEGRQEEEVVIRRFLRLAQCQAQRRICRRGRKPAVATAANRPADKTTTEGVGEKRGTAFTRHALKARSKVGRIQWAMACC